MMTEPGRTGNATSSSGPPSDQTDRGKEKLSKRGMTWFFIVQALIIIAVFFLLLDLGTYGWTLFGILPLSLGITLGSFTRTSKSKKILRIVLLGVAAIAGLGGLLLLSGVEGAICIFMALGIIAGPIFIGLAIGYAIRNAFKVYVLIAIAVLNFSFYTYDYLDTSEVKSIAEETVVIDAPRERVWDVLTHRVDFDNNKNVFFRAGVNYPQSMQLQYQGGSCFLVCTLSTGNVSLVVDRVDSLRSIRFSVPSTIVPMKELTPYDSLDAAHLEGYFKPQYGEFRLEKISDTQTRIAARTAYTYKITPIFYWRWWSDYLINAMHRSVLRDVKEKAEL